MSVAAERLPIARRRTGVWAFVKRHVLTAYAIGAFVYLLLPIAVVIAFSFNDPKGRFNYVWQGFTLDNWIQWNAVPGLQDAVVLSLEIALLSSAIATALGDRKSTRLNSSHLGISYAVFCLKKKNRQDERCDIQ